MDRQVKCLRQVDQRAGLGRALPADRPARRRPVLRGRRPRQQPVRQGRGRLPAQGRAPARPAAPAPDRVQRGRPGQDRQRGRRGQRGRSCGRSSRTSTCRPSTARSTRWGRFTPISHTLISEQGGVDKISATMLDHGVGGRRRGHRQRPDRRLHRRPLDPRRRRPGPRLRRARPVRRWRRRAAAYVECAVGDRVLWGVGLHSSIVKASLTAVLSAVNRAERMAPAE